MKNRLIPILEETLKKAGALEPAVQGKQSGMLALTREDQRQLLSQMKTQLKFINNIIIAIVVLHFLLFALSAFLVLYYRDSPNVILLLLGGSVLSLMVIISSLISLVKTKGKIDCIFITLPNLSPEQAMIMLQSIYFEEVKLK
jgi:hypothetical protein